MHMLAFFATVLLAVTQNSINAVGFEHSSLASNGVYCVEQNFRSLKAFPTMKDQISFTDPESFVGCKLIVDLDGIHWVYDVVKYNKAETDYELVAVHRKCRYTSALDGIPAQKKFWIETRTNCALEFSTAGEVCGKYEELLNGPQAKSQVSSPRKITLIESDSEKAQILTITKGRINVTRPSP